MCMTKHLSKALFGQESFYMRSLPVKTQFFCNGVRAKTQVAAVVEK